LIEYSIIDQNKSNEVGKFEFSKSYSDKKNLGNLVLSDKIYNCRIVKPDIRLKLFKKDSLGHSKFEMRNSSDLIVYKFHIVYKYWISVGDSNYPFNGQINTTTNDLMVVL
jgi:hypothetical protein